MYKIIVGNYEDYIKWNGLKTEKNPIALEIKDRICRYYIIFQDNEYFSEVVVFEEKNLINLNITFGIKHYLVELINFFKENKYHYITFSSDENIYKDLDTIRKKCKCIEEYKENITMPNSEMFEITYIKVEL